MDDDENKTDRELLQEAFQALLLGDTAKRDRLCDLIQIRLNARAATRALEEAAYSTKH